PSGLDDSGRAAPPELVAALDRAKLLGGMFGKRNAPEVEPRGFLGVEVDDGGGKVSVRSVLARGPADPAGLKAGDEITRVEGKRLVGASEWESPLPPRRPGQPPPLPAARPAGPAETPVPAGEAL